MKARTQAQASTMQSIDDAGGTAPSMPAVHRGLQEWRSGKWSCVLAYVASGLSILLCAAPVCAATRTWQGVDTAWTNTANWSGGVVPIDGDDVVIPATANDPIMNAGTNPATGAYLSFSVSNAVTVTCLGDTTVTNEASGGGVDGDGTIHGIGVTLHVSGDATIAGTLDADVRGFPQQQGPGNSGNKFYGAGYGGRGSLNSGTLGMGGAGATYGSASRPTALGSGGRNVENAGGGAIKLVVGGTLELSGTVTANGGSSFYSGGSGGSIWLVADTLAGDGLVRARGGVASQFEKGSGGGGRIALDYQTLTFTGVVSAAGGRGSTDTVGQPGTVWTATPWFDAGTAEVPAEMVFDRTVGGQFIFPAGSPTHYWDLHVEDTWVEFPGATLDLGDLVLTNRGVFRTVGPFGGTGNLALESLSVSEGIDVHDGSVLYLASEGTYDLTEDLFVDSDSYLQAFGNRFATNAASGGTGAEPHGAGVSIAVAGDATILGTLDGNGLGFPSKSGPGFAGNSPGGTYGGLGGSSTADPYGRLDRPTALGSGGHLNAAGGAIFLDVAQTLLVEGSITVKGVAGYYVGSGGSIWLRAATLAGGGAINAEAGNVRFPDANRRAGGGGRISLEYAVSDHTGSVSVATFYPGNDVHTGRTGTLFTCTSPWPGAGTTGYGGISLDSTFSADGNDVKIVRGVTSWRTGVLEWSDASTRIDGTPLANTAEYTLSGLPPEKGCWVYTNGVPMHAGKTNATATGVLEIGGVSLSGDPVTIQVKTSPPGTVLWVR